MNRHTLTVFDDYLQTASNTLTATSSEEFNKVLGMFDQIAYSVTLEQCIGSANPTISVWLDHSADGVNWITKPQSPAQISGAYVVPSNTNVFPGFDDGTQPNLEFVRFGIELDSVDPPILVHLQIVATINDSRDSRFARRMRALIKKNHDLNHCKRMLQGGTPLQSTVNGVPRNYQQELVDLAEGGKSKKWGDPQGAQKAQLEKAMKPYTVHDGRNLKLAPDAMVCFRPDGSVVLSRPGHPPVAIQPAPAHDGSGTGHSGGPC